MPEITPFLSGLRPPESDAGPALWFAVRGRELLVRAQAGSDPLPEPAALGLEARCTHYLGALGELHCWSVELAPDARRFDVRTWGRRPDCGRGEPGRWRLRSTFQPISPRRRPRRAVARVAARDAGRAGPRRRLHVHPTDDPGTMRA